MRLELHLDEGADEGTGGEPDGSPRSKLGVAKLPAFIHLSPPGPLVEGRDGRSFSVGDPALVLAATEPDLPLLVDWDHESMFGMSTKAAAWVDSLKFVPLGEESAEFPVAGFWGHITDWTPEGADDVLKKRFRMLSPVIRHQELEIDEETGEPLDEDGPPMLLAFENVALTNRPNLRMVSMNSAHSAHGESAMSEEDAAALRVLLGLDADAEGPALVEAVRGLVMPNVDEPPPEEEPDEDEEPAPEVTQLSADLAAANAANRVLLSERDEARAGLAEYTASQAAELLTVQTKSVDDAIANGHAVEANRDDLLTLATSKRESDRSMFARLVEHRIGGAPKRRVTKSAEASPRSGSKRGRVTGHKADVAALTEAEQHTYRAMKSANFSHAKIMDTLDEKRAAV